MQRTAWPPSPPPEDPYKILEGRQSLTLDSLSAHFDDMMLLNLLSALPPQGMEEQGEASLCALFFTSFPFAEYN